MPELPEVETIRRGLERTVVGRRIRSVEVHHPRTIRRHPAGAEDFAALLAGRRVDGALRRGKFLWLPLDSGDALVAHLGMSGQLLLVPPGTADRPHLRARFTFDDDGPELRFVDQRTFGGMAVAVGGAAVPSTLRHIALDPVDPGFDDEAFADAVRGRRTGLKRALLDQRLISGIGAIYADEALWRARLHWARATKGLTRPDVRRLLEAIRAVLAEAIEAGGTSFDATYVNLDGERGLFEPTLHVYGRAGEPCDRCGTAIIRSHWMNRSAYWCPRCQPWPRHPHP